MILCDSLTVILFRDDGLDREGTVLPLIQADHKSQLQARRIHSAMALLPEHQYITSSTD